MNTAAILLISQCDILIQRYQTGYGTFLSYHNYTFLLSLLGQGLLLGTGVFNLQVSFLSVCVCVCVCVVCVVCVCVCVCVCMVGLSKGAFHKS